MEYKINNRYIVICQNIIQSRKYKVNRIIIGELTGEKEKSLIFETCNGNKRVQKRTISKLINITNVVSMNEQFLIERIEGALV